LLTSSQNHFRPRLLSTSERNCWDGNVSHLPLQCCTIPHLLKIGGSVSIWDAHMSLWLWWRITSSMCVSTTLFWTSFYRNTLIFRNAFHRSKFHTIGLSLFSFFVHHTIILNFITQTWLHLVCFYVPTMSNRSSLHYITRSILFISRVSPNSNSPTSCHCSTYTTCHRPSYIFYFIDILLVTIYSIYTKHHLYCILSTAYSNSI
jgi:hypothetical protein